MTRPNILWICTDQQRYDTIRALGNSCINTPNIDRLVAEGVAFTHAFTQSPVCTPSRAAMLTGRYPRTTRCRQNGQRIPADERLITRILADQRYTCGLSGKLHLASCAGGRGEERIDDGYSTFHWSHHGELYDLGEDPDEFQNLWNDPTHAAMKMRLLKQAFDASVLTMDPLPLRLGAF